MSFWPSQIPLAIHAWLPLGLAAFVPLALLAAVIWLPHRARAIATVLSLRTVLVLGLGFALLVAVATVSVVHTGLSELRQRHESGVRGLAGELARTGPARVALEGPLKLTLFRAKDPSVAFVAFGEPGCAGNCLIDVDNGLSTSDVKRRLATSWPTRSGAEYAVAIGGRPFLLVAEPVLVGARSATQMVVAGIDAEYLADQATATAWILLIISYALLVLVGWSSWKQIDTTLGARIHAITSQIKDGSTDKPIETLKLDGVELRELASSVSAYIKSTLEAQKSNDERYRRLVDLSPDGVIMCSRSSIKFANSAALALSGAKSRYDVIGVPIEQFLEFETDSRVDQLKTAPRPARWKRVDGTILHVDVAEIADASEGTAQYLIRDVTDRRNREALLAHRAEHDSLTGLVNRARFESRLSEVLEPGSINPRLGAVRQIAVLFIDLDGFKPVNDRYGHAAGDAVLVAVAERLRDSTRNSDLIARLGGDEFAILLEVRDHEEVTNVADRILASLENAIEFDGQKLRVGASIGIADTRVGTPGETPLGAVELLRAADAAMYTAKQSGGNRAAA
ncbi:MAG TPA: diguanylate cyclase [Gemmatimonadaceae bacterium]|nr:diguanylate cyclase [Gemmatimonadaceae bacterium]